MIKDFTAEYWQEMQDEIMDNFDFDKVHRCMTALDWHWASTNGVPGKADLRRNARKMLRDCVERNHGGTGGFKVFIDREEGVLTLSFMVEEWDAYSD